MLGGGFAWVSNTSHIGVRRVLWVVSLYSINVYKEQVSGIEMSNSTPSTAYKCNILSIKKKILEIQRSMLSMDTPIEKYLEMGALGLIVWTRLL